MSALLESLLTPHQRHEAEAADAALSDTMRQALRPLFSTPYTVPPIGCWDPDLGPYTGHPSDPRSDDDDPAYEAALDAFGEALQRGVDRPLPLDLQVPARWRVSQLLGSSQDAAALLLFRACVFAVQRRDAEAAQALREYADKAAEDYADGNRGAWA